MRRGGGFFNGFLVKGFALHRCTSWSKNVHFFWSNFFLSFFWLGRGKGTDEKACMNWSIGGTCECSVWLLKEEEVCVCMFLFVIFCGVFME